MFCPKCKKQNNKECSHLSCPRCRKQNDDSHKYCYHCGMVLKENITDELGEMLLTEEEVARLLRFSYVFEINNLVDEAIEAYSAITEVHPNWGDIRFKLARAYEARGQYGKAIAEYKKAISINKNYLEAHRCLGELYSDEGFYEEAIEEFKIVLNTKNQFDYVDVHNNIGVALEKLGRVGEAAEKYRKALESNPEYGDALFNLAKFHYEKKAIPEALKLITKARTLYPRNERYRKLEVKVKKISD